MIESLLLFFSVVASKMTIELVCVVVSAMTAVISTSIALIIWISSRKSPLIRCVLKDDEKAANLIISNLGNKTAKNIKFKVDGSLAKHLRIDISKLNFVALAPDENFIYWVGNWTDFYKHGNDLDLTIVSYYDGLFNRFFRNTSTYIFSLQSLSKSSNITNWSRRIHKQMENIGQNLGKMNTSFDRYRRYIERESQKKPGRNFSQRIELQRVKRQKRV